MAEASAKKNHFAAKVYKDKRKQFLDDFARGIAEKGLYLPREDRNFIEQEIENLIQKHFFSEVEREDDIEIFHEWEDQFVRELESIIQKLRSSFRVDFSKLHAEDKTLRTELDRIRRRIREAESKVESEYLKTLKAKKEKARTYKKEFQGRKEDLIAKNTKVESELKSLRQKKTDLLVKIQVSEKNRPKDLTLKGLVDDVTQNITRIKEEKKKSLEESMLISLNDLMHKKSFVHRVTVDISPEGEYIDINLLDENENIIDRNALSMGERQLYASALLKSLVDESDIEFPVFIDSPMQKFDVDHSENIIEQFYPNVSHQVILFPLLGKEVTRSEYDLLLPKVESTYLIDNYAKNKSRLVAVKPGELFQEFEKMTHAVN